VAMGYVDGLDEALLGQLDEVRAVLARVVR